MSYNIGIVGLGSIGSRHLLNVVSVLTAKNESFAIDVIRSGHGKEIGEDLNQNIRNIYYDFDLSPNDYDVIFITNPTNLHCETIKQFASKTKHMFIEKPVFDNAEIAPESLHLSADGVYYVACPLRYCNVIDYIKHKVDPQQVFSVRVICSSYLPEWRPGQDYRNSYSAHHDQGGGVSIDLIHELDYIFYLFGKPEQVFNIRGTFSNLEIDSDDLSLYLAKYKDKTVEVHLDYFGRKTIREIQLFTDKDTIVGDIVESEIRFLKSGEVVSFRQQRNDYQLREIEHFFNIIEGKDVNDNDIATALEVLKIAKGNEPK